MALALRVVMKWQSHLSIFTCFFSVKNYDACNLATRLNERVCKAIEEAREEELCKKIEEDVPAKLTAYFNDQWAEKKVALKNELAEEKVARK